MDSASLTQKQAKRNILALQVTETSSFGYLFSIPVMVDYIDRYTVGGEEVYFFLATIMNVVGIVFALFLGAYSDLFKRKNIMIIGALLRLSGWALFALFPGYWMFLSGLILHVIAFSCTKSSACLYETMQASGQGTLYRKIEKLLYAIPQYILMVGFPLAGFLYTIEPYWPFVLNIVFCAVAAISLCFYSEAPRLKAGHASVLKLIKDVLTYLKNKRCLRWLTLFGGFTLGMVYMMIFLVQAGFYAVGGSVLLFSVIIPFFFLLRAITAQQSEIFFKGESDNEANIRGLGVITLGLGAGLLLTGMSPHLYIYISFAFVYMFFHGMLHPAFNFVYNDALSSDIRATAFAAQVIVMRVSSIALNALAGFCLLWIGAQGTLSLFGGLFLTVSLGLLWLYARNLGDRE